MKYTGYHHEKPRQDLQKKLSKHNTSLQKNNVWNTFANSDLTDVTGDDFSIIPRVLPLSYWPTIKRTSYLITKFTMELLSLPEKEIRAIIPKGPNRDYLINELEVLRFRKGRITGSYRFDMAIVGAPVPGNLPKLLEINEIGFDGLARSTYFQNVLLELMPDVRKRLKSLDTAAAEIKNMQRLGKALARFQYDEYNWDEEFLIKTGKRLGSEIRLISPLQFGCDLEKNSPMLEQKKVSVKGGRVCIGNDWKPHAINMSYAYELSDYIEGHSLYSKFVRSKTPQYGPFLTGLVAAKTILILLADPLLQKKLLGKSNALGASVLPAHLLSDSKAEDSIRGYKEWVIKHTDGCGGELVFMNQELLKRVRKTPANQRHEWVLQQKTKLNLIDVNGILSQPKKAISDLGVFVQYDWDGKKFRHFEVGGLMTRATNKSLKVNVSGGGLQVAVLLDRAN